MKIIQLEEDDMFTSADGLTFVLPACYHPTTLICVDDEIDFLKILSVELSEKIAIIFFDSPEKAISFIKTQHQCFPFTERCLVKNGNEIELKSMAIRNEIINKDRFRLIVIFVTDYDMPDTDGVELIRSMEFPQEISENSHIILSGKISDGFKEKLSNLNLSTEYIGKDDPDYINKLIKLVEKRSAKIFQWYSYSVARLLSRNQHEKTTTLLDGNFATIFNAHIKDNNICEFYLFDKQGSYLFLDDKANLSWLFVRNELGVANSIAIAEQYGAPESVINALRDKKMILSLYEKEDFELRKNINWDDYLLPATIFESDDKYLSLYPDLIPSEGSSIKYYYAFSKDFPEHGIDVSNILSYRDFLAS